MIARVSRGIAMRIDTFSNGLVTNGRYMRDIRDSN